MMLDATTETPTRAPRFVRLRMLAEPWLYLSPTLVLIGLFIFAPMLIGISYAFQNIQLLNPLESGWVGLDNFRAMFDDRRFFKALGHTVNWTLTSLVLQFFLGLGLALLLGLVFFSATGLTWSRWAGENISQLRSHFGWLTPQVNTALHPEPAMTMTMDEHAEHQGHMTMAHDAAQVAIHPAQFDRVLSAARAAGIDAAKLEIRPAYQADKAWTVNEIDRSWPTQVDSVAVNPQNNQVIDKVEFAQFGLLAKLTRWGVDAHMGVLFGLANQLVLALFGLGLCVMIVIGYRMWWLRRPAGGKVAPLDTLLGCWRPLSISARFLLLVIVAVAAVSLPVMGASLLVLLAIDMWRWRRVMT